MAVNESRSANADMKLGQRDGRYKSLTPSRGGEVDMSNVAIRAKEIPMHYGFVNDHGEGCACGSC
jgi:hypothetical protein